MNNPTEANKRELNHSTIGNFTEKQTEKKESFFQEPYYDLWRKWNERNRKTGEALCQTASERERSLVWYLKRVCSRVGPVCIKRNPWAGSTDCGLHQNGTCFTSLFRSVLFYFLSNIVHHCWWKVAVFSYLYLVIRSDDANSYRINNRPTFNK